jgi:hypothetical protein
MRSPEEDVPVKINIAIAIIAIGVVLGSSPLLQAQFQFATRAKDPGVRGGQPGAGGAIAGLTGEEQEMFDAGQEEFGEEEGVTDGIGPRFNFVGCKGCHVQPATGGSSPTVNPLFRVTKELGFTGNIIPSFIMPNGPIREARFPFKSDGTRDGGVHALFVITGHPSAQGCGIKQEDFETQVRNRNHLPDPQPGLRSGADRADSRQRHRRERDGPG